jgi:hypothetical protein
MLADFGWTQYINTVETTETSISEKPEILRNFLKATAEGWRLYLADPKATNEELIRLNPQLDMPTLVEGFKMIKDNNCSTAATLPPARSALSATSECRRLSMKWSVPA